MKLNPYRFVFMAVVIACSAAGTIGCKQSPEATADVELSHDQPPEHAPLVAEPSPPLPSVESVVAQVQASAKRVQDIAYEVDYRGFAYHGPEKVSQHKRFVCQDVRGGAYRFVTTYTRKKEGVYELSERDVRTAAYAASGSASGIHARQYIFEGAGMSTSRSQARRKVISNPANLAHHAFGSGGFDVLDLDDLRFNASDQKWTVRWASQEEGGGIELEGVWENGDSQFYKTRLLIDTEHGYLIRRVVRENDLGEVVYQRDTPRVTQVEGAWLPVEVVETYYIRTYGKEIASALGLDEGDVFRQSRLVFSHFSMGSSLGFDEFNLDLLMLHDKAMITFEYPDGTTLREQYRRGQE